MRSLASFSDMATYTTDCETPFETMAATPTSATATAAAVSNFGINTTFLVLIGKMALKLFQRLDR
jgi:hypothetical protein